MGHCSLTETNRQRPKKWLLSKFSLLLHIYSSRRNFFVCTKISYLQPFREIMGGQKKLKFSTKNDATGQKNDFFRIFLFCCTSSRQDETFLLLPNYISSAVQRNHGGTKKKRYIEQRRTNDERRTTNDERTNERRTTLTMIIARQDSFRILGLTTDIFWRLFIKFKSYEWGGGSRHLRYFEFMHKNDSCWILGLVWLANSTVSILDYVIM